MNDVKEELFEELYRKYYQMSFRYIFSKVKNYWIAEDLLSEVFIKIYKHRDEICDVNKSKYWIIKIANNTIIDYYRKNNKVKLDDIVDNEAVHEIGYDNILVRDEFMTLTQNLPVEVKEMLVMRFFHDLKFKDIGRIMNLTESSAKNKVYNAVRTVKKVYNYNLQ